MFRIAKREGGDGGEACEGCHLLTTKPNPFATDEIDEKNELYEEIKDIIFCEDAGSPTDWSLYDFDYFKLVAVYREAEKQIRQLQTSRMQAYLRSKFERN